MLLSELLMETPQLIEPISTTFGVNNDTTNRDLYHYYRKRVSKLVHSFSDHMNIVRVENPSGEDFDFQYVGFDDENKRIGFVSRVVVDNDRIIGRNVYQSFVWVGDDYKSQFSTWPNKIVFDYLIPKYQTITTDRLHTELGMKYWFKLIKRSLDKGLNVYYYNLHSHELMQVLTPGHLLELQKMYKIWDEANDSMNKLMVISTKKLTTK